MTAEIQSLDQQIASKSLLQHPFYVAWSRGELSLPALREYAVQYYRHVAAFPTYISAVHAQCDDLAVRRHLLANLSDEEAGSPNHPELWLQFAAGLGVSQDDVEAAQPWPETQRLIDTFRAACGTAGVAAGVAALYAYESQIPAVAESKIRGLRAFYGIEDAASLEYFTVHEAADREHSAVERDLLSSRVHAENLEQVSSETGKVLNALNGVLSAVCVRHGITQN
ncbi:MAG TPA: pyrroloquinoline quinone biosynthesis protein PqqC [Solibacterales bacterium]|nr:pyrroloquinoline quinone biosynthesis protein PqqC [Bryobacterales bacterium]